MRCKQSASAARGWRHRAATQLPPSADVCVLDRSVPRFTAPRHQCFSTCQVGARSGASQRQHARDLARCWAGGAPGSDHTARLMPWSRSRSCQRVLCTASAPSVRQTCAPGPARMPVRPTGPPCRAGGQHGAVLGRGAAPCLRAYAPGTVAGPAPGSRTRTACRSPPPRSAWTPRSPGRAALGQGQATSTRLRTACGRRAADHPVERMRLAPLRALPREPVQRALLAAGRRAHLARHVHLRERASGVARRGLAAGQRAAWRRAWRGRRPCRPACALYSAAPARRESRRCSACCSRPARTSC